MRKFLFFLALFPIFVMAENTKCYSLDDFEQVFSCYNKVGDSADLGNKSRAEVLDEFNKRTQRWMYSVEKDEMRNVSTYGAVVHSQINKYGNTSFMRLAYSEKERSFFMLFMLHNKNDSLKCKTSECKIFLKIDDEKVVEIPVIEMKGILTIMDQSILKDLVKKFKTSKKLLVELPLLKNEQQFEFNLEGLKWDNSWGLNNEK